MEPISLKCSRCAGREGSPHPTPATPPFLSLPSPGMPIPGAAVAVAATKRRRWRKLRATTGATVAKEQLLTWPAQRCRCLCPRARRKRRLRRRRRRRSSSSSSSFSRFSSFAAATSFRLRRRPDSGKLLLRGRKGCCGGGGGLCGGGYGVCPARWRRRRRIKSPWCVGT